MSSKEKVDEGFSHRSLQDCDTIVEYLRAIERGFESGRLLLCAGTDELILKPRGLVNFHVKAKRREDSAKVTLRISWRERSVAEVAEKPLIIRADEKDDD